MKFLVTLKYPSGYRYRKEIEAESHADAEIKAETLAVEKDDKFWLNKNDPRRTRRIVKIESITGIKPRTRADILLERWAKDTREMARRMIWYDAQRRCYHSVDGYGENLTFSGFDELDEAWEHQIAHLNSAAEVGK